MSDHDERESEVERLARSINEAGDAFGEAIGCLGRGCMWAVLGFIAVEVAFVAVGAPFEILADRIGPWPALAIFVVLGWLGLRTWRRHRAGRGVPPT